VEPARHTLVLSDLHLADAEPENGPRPHWKAFKQRRFFVDGDVGRLVDHALATIDGPAELVLNGDVFDFDCILGAPDDHKAGLHWLEQLRGLGSEEWASAWKMDVIVRDHPEFFAALRRWLDGGHELVFVFGNHDLELHWPPVQECVRKAISGDTTPVRFCEWFYLSDGDAFVTHGHQYDPYCATDPVHPLIEVRGKWRVRIPFGDLANRFMLNGMGYFNPHATHNYIMSGKEYVRFFFKYMLRTQPLLLWTWFWSACATLLVGLDTHLRPAMRDPLTVEERVQGIAERANATPAQVRRLAALDVPTAFTRPWMVARELWLDRGVLFLAMVWGAWQVVSAVNWVWRINPLWVLLPFALLFPLFLAYSFRVKPETFSKPLLTPERAAVVQAVTGVRFVVMGHTHEPLQRGIGEVQFLNGGFWSPAFAEPECHRRIGTQTFVWLKPGPDGHRVAELWEWPPGGTQPWPFVASVPREASRLMKAVRATRTKIQQVVKG
jgi:UDP-2,3-diacylglucosamine pyrophosphatase LpxH